MGSVGGERMDGGVMVGRGGVLRKRGMNEVRGGVGGMWYGDCWKLVSCLRNSFSRISTIVRGAKICPVQ